MLGSTFSFGKLVGFWRVREGEEGRWCKGEDMESLEIGVESFWFE